MKANSIDCAGYSQATLHSISVFKFNLGVQQKVLSEPKANRELCLSQTVWEKENAGNAGTSEVIRELGATLHYQRRLESSQPVILSTCFMLI